MAALPTSPTDRAMARVELRKIASRQDPCKWRAMRDLWARSIARSACEQPWVPSRSVCYAFLVADRLASIESAQAAAHETPCNSHPPDCTPHPRVAPWRSEMG